MTTRVPIKHLFEVSRQMVMPNDYGNGQLFHYSLPAWHEHGDGIIENASDLASGKLLLKGGEVLVSKLNPEKSAVLLADEHDIPTVCSPEFIALVPKKIDRTFAYYFMLSAPLRHQLNASVESVTNSHKRARVDRFLASSVDLPDLATQRQIANFLDRETARIERMIEKKKRSVVLLRERITSLITQVTMHGMKGEDHRDTRIDWWSRAPASWEVHRIASLFRESKEMGEEGLPVLSVSINWGISDRELADEDRDRIVNLIEDKTSYKRVRPGDLVYNMMRAWQGAFGVAKVDGLVSPAYVVARPKKGIHSAYFEYLLRTPACVEEFRRASKGIADFRQRLYWEHFRQVRLFLPEFDEQVQIAAYIECEQAQIAPTVSKTQESIEHLREYRSALITAAVLGQIDVSTYAKSGTSDRFLDKLEK